MCTPYRGFFRPTPYAPYIYPLPTFHFEHEHTHKPSHATVRAAGVGSKNKINSGTPTECEMMRNACSAGKITGGSIKFHEWLHVLHNDLMDDSSDSLSYRPTASVG